MPSDDPAAPRRTPSGAKNVAKEWQGGLQAAGPYLGLGLQLAGTMIFFIGAGYALDYWLDTLPVFLLIGAGVGMTAFFIQLMRVSREMGAQAKADRERRKRAADDARP